EVELDVRREEGVVAVRAAEEELAVAALEVRAEVELLGLEPGAAVIALDPAVARVVAAETMVRAEPQVAARVPADAVHDVVREPVVRGQIPELRDAARHGGHTVQSGARADPQRP